jgi:hypothetical protein
MIRAYDVTLSNTAIRNERNITNTEQIYKFVERYLCSQLHPSCMKLLCVVSKKKPEKFLTSDNVMCHCSKSQVNDRKIDGMIKYERFPSILDNDLNGNQCMTVANKFLITGQDGLFLI